MSRACVLWCVQAFDEPTHWESWLLMPISGAQAPSKSCSSPELSAGMSSDESKAQDCGSVQS